VGQHLQSFSEFPPRQKPGSFSLDQVLAKLQELAAAASINPRTFESSRTATVVSIPVSNLLDL